MLVSYIDQLKKIETSLFRDYSILSICNDYCLKFATIYSIHPEAILELKPGLDDRTLKVRAQTPSLQIDTCWCTQTAAAPCHPNLALIPKESD